MDTGRIRRDLKLSFSVVATAEWRLIAGAIVGLLVYVFWVGATGAALQEISGFVGVSTALEPWTSETTGLAVLGIVLWVFLPAVAVVYFLHRELTNLHGNLEKYYRLGHPPLLLGPPLVVLAGGLAGFVAIGEPRWPLLGLLVVGAVSVHTRTVTYSYRVFSLSLPRLLTVSLFPTAILLIVTTMTGTATAVGREEFVADAAAGFGDAVGVSGIGNLVGGSTTVAAASLPTVVAATIAVPVAVSGAYIAVQFLVGLIVRALAREVPRSDLRTGQRYPVFAQPTTSKQPSVSPTASSESDSAQPDTAQSDQATATAADETADSTASTGTADSAGADESTASSGADEADETAADDVSHTRVFTPSTEDENTQIAGGSGDDESTCPYCEADLPPNASECPSCDARL